MKYMLAWKQCIRALEKVQRYKVNVAILVPLLLASMHLVGRCELVKCSHKPCTV